MRTEQRHPAWRLTEGVAACLLLQRAHPEQHGARGVHLHAERGHPAVHAPVPAAGQHLPHGAGGVAGQPVAQEGEGEGEVLRPPDLLLVQHRHRIGAARQRPLPELEVFLLPRREQTPRRVLGEGELPGFRKKRAHQAPAAKP